MTKNIHSLRYYTSRWFFLLWTISTYGLLNHYALAETIPSTTKKNEAHTAPQSIKTETDQIQLEVNDDFIEHTTSTTDTGEEIARPLTTKLIERSVNKLIDQRNYLSKKIVRLAKKVDRFIGQEEADESLNESFMRTRLSTTLNKAGDVDVSAQFKLKLDLPLSKKRYRLIIENDPNSDNESLGNKEITVKEGDLDDDENRQFLSGFRYVISDELEKWYVATDVGLRIRLHPTVFTRLKAKRDYKLNELWRFRIKESIYYFNDSGLGEKTQFFFYRPIHNTLRFRSTSEAKWSKDESAFEFAQVFSFLKTLDEKTAIKYQFGILGESQPTERTTDYYLNANYRKLIYQDWLFFEIKPQLLWKREDDWALSPSITFRLEVFFLSNQYNNL